MTSKKLIIYGFLLEILLILLVGTPSLFSTNIIPPKGLEPLGYLLGVILGLVVIYILVYSKLKLDRDNPQYLKIIIIFTILFSLTLVIIPPIGSADIYNYIYNARIYNNYHHNPYQATPEYLENDFFLQNYPLENRVNPNSYQYGPLWFWLSIPLNILGGDNPILNLWIFKFFIVLINFGCLGLIYKILKLKNPQWCLLGTFLYAWNPAILFESANNGHNDFVMIFLVLLAIYLYLKNKKILVIPVLILSILTKYITILLLPLFVLLLLKEISNLKEKVYFSIKSFLPAVFLTIVIFTPIWIGFSTFEGLRKISSSFNFYEAAPLPFLIFNLMGFIKFNILDFLSFSKIVNIVRGISLVIFLIVFFKIIFSKIKLLNFSQLIYKSFLILASYLLLASFFVSPWYLIWLVPLLIILTTPYFNNLTIFISSLEILSYIVWGSISISLLLVLLTLVLLGGIMGKNLFRDFKFYFQKFKEGQL